ncbi:MAG TPA: hypothetical protein VN456_14795 [Desulfosporosinus sp.]|nr:hypothetical protein [Desulfosporosinus sp.]
MLKIAICNGESYELQESVAKNGKVYPVDTDQQQVVKNHLAKEQQA